MPASAYDDRETLPVPVSIQDVEFTAFEAPAVSARYEAVWLLVRLRGVPVGYLKLPTRET